MNKENKSGATDGIKKSISETTRALSGNETIKINNNVFRTNDKKAKNLVIQANIT